MTADDLWSAMMRERPRNVSAAATVAYGGLVRSAIDISARAADGSFDEADARKVVDEVLAAIRSGGGR